MVAAGCGHSARGNRLLTEFLYQWPKLLGYGTMLDEIDRQETSLRRRLLFQLLRNFDFDNPTIRECEKTNSEAVPCFLDLMVADEFQFNLSA